MPAPGPGPLGQTVAMLLVVGPVASEEHRHVGHPERPERMAAVMEGVSALHLGDDLLFGEAEEASMDQLRRVHTPAYLDHLQRLSTGGGGQLDPDTYATAGSWDAARRSAGAGLVAVRSLREGKADLAFVAARPPGHHALADRSMGFCLVNNVAVAAAALLEAGERVMIVDWDVHHGNGTQDLFWDEPGVLYVSVHQWPCYPGTGRAEEVGGANARGTIVNLPLPPGATGDVVERAFDRVVSPVAAAFQPTWVLVSAGFDAHRADPLADLELSAGDFATLATTVASYASTPGRLVLFLEGGYDLGALRSSVTATLGALVGATDSTAPDESATTGGPGVDRVEAIETRRYRAEDVHG